MSSAYDVRRVVAALVWPTDPISLHLVSPDLPAPVLHDPDPMRIVRREGGTITPDGGPLTTAAYDRARQWRQPWLALFEPALTDCDAGPGSWVRALSAGAPAGWPSPGTSRSARPRPPGGSWGSGTARS